LSVLILAYRAARIAGLVVDVLAGVMPMLLFQMGIRPTKLLPTIRRLVENFALLPHRAEALTTVLQSIGRALALS
jgi:hypothetical protein